MYKTQAKAIHQSRAGLWKAERPRLSGWAWEKQKIRERGFWRRGGFWIIGGLLWMIASGWVWGADKNGVSPQAISLPSGPGSLEGLGEAFQPMLNTGTARYQVKIAVPAGVAGHTPELSLNYDGGMGESAAGPGWSFGPGGISRQVDRGLPRYIDGNNQRDDDFDGQIDNPEELDRFTGPDGEELVRLGDDFFRARVENQFLRYKRVGEHWEARTKDGQLLEFGLTPQGRITDPTGLKVFRWMLERETDLHGNIIEYHYTSFGTSEGQRYLSEVRYGPGASPWSAFYSVNFIYGDRPDWFEDYRSGFLIKTNKRLERIAVSLQGSALPNASQADWNHDGQPEWLIRGYEITYGHAGIQGPRLTQVKQFGADGQSYLPPISFTYHHFSAPARLAVTGAVVELTQAPFPVVDDPLMEFIDLNADGLPDLLKTEAFGGAHRAYLNLGTSPNSSEIKWSAAREVTSTDGLAWGLNLGNGQVHLSDLDGDGLADLVQTNLLGEVSYFRNLGTLGWGKKTSIELTETGVPSPFGKPNVRSMDLNFDKRMDIVYSTENGYSIWFNLGNRKYSREVRVPGAVWQGQALEFDKPGVRLADLNGDRLQDVVWISPTRLLFFANQGYGNFAGGVSIPIPDQLLTDGQGGQVERAQLQDLDGDGLDDLVIERAAPGELWYWLNRGQQRLNERRILSGLPASYNEGTVTRWLDLNGNGTTDLVYADSTHTARLRFIDLGLLLHRGKLPNLLAVLDNGLGAETRIFYRSSSDYQAEALALANPWLQTAPLALTLVAKVETQSHLDTDEEAGEETYIKEFIYRDPYYDPLEKAFRGFAEVRVKEAGDPSSPSSVTVHRFYTGAPDALDNDGNGQVDEVSAEGFREEEALKGRLREMEWRDESQTLFKREKQSWQVKTLLSTSEEIKIRWAPLVQKETEVYEGTLTPKLMRITYEFDGYGNPTAERNEGVVGETNDEVHTSTLYIADTNRWLLSFPKIKTVTDASGKKLSETLHYYDGPAFQGLALGEIERGRLTRASAWVKDNVYVDTERKEFDDYGNPIGLKDPLGNRRRMTYDLTLHAFPIEEAIELKGDPKALSVSAHYHLGFGKITQSLDFNGQTTIYRYDTFGRPTATIKPGDSLNWPTVQYRYWMADPLRNWLYVYDGEGKLNRQDCRLSCDDPNRRASASVIQTFQREAFGQPGTLDSLQYLDGLGRKLAKLEEDESGFIVQSALLHNAKGKTRRNFLPYHTTKAGWQKPNKTLPHSEHQYDALGREIQVIHPAVNGAEARTRTEYLPLQTRFVNENNVGKIAFQDGLERLKSIYEENRGEIYITRYEYDALGNLLKVVDAQGNTKTMSYDGLKRRTEMNDPNRGRTTYAYDAASNLTESTDAKGQVNRFTYDEANRLLTEAYPDPDNRAFDVRYLYDAPLPEFPEALQLKGHLAGVYDEAGVTAWSYDARGNQTHEFRRLTLAGTVTREFRSQKFYDATERPLRQVWPDGQTLDFRYNARGLLKAIPGVLEELRYQTSGQPEAMSYANGIQTLYTYDERLRMKELQTRPLGLAATVTPAGSSTALQHWAYIYDGVGNLLQILDKRGLAPGDPLNGTQDFRYDPLNRLTEAQGQGYGAIRYQYDSIGNKISQLSPNAGELGHIADVRINLGVMSYGGLLGSTQRTGRQAGDPPGPQAFTGSASGLQYQYDANGNLIRRGNEETLTWDARDRLQRIEKGLQNAQYTYDYRGQRARKVIQNGAETRTTLYVSQDYEEREDQRLKYIWLGGKRIAQIAQPLEASQAQETQSFDLKAGWNLIALQVQPAVTSLAEAFSPLAGKLREVHQYDPLSQQYLTFRLGSTSNSLTHLETQKGYLVWMESAATWSVRGPKRLDSQTLTKGWHLIGAPVDRRLPVNEALASLAGKIKVVWGWETGSQKWRRFDPNPQAPAFLNDLEALEPGQAYWVEMLGDSLLTPTTSPYPGITFYHSDHLGSSDLMTGLDGTVIHRGAYYPFGLPRAESPAGTAPAYRYTGKELDFESQLMYYEARYYEPISGRFASIDPLFVELGSGDEKIFKRFLNNPQEGNLYAYAGNNPIIYNDPSGQASTAVLEDVVKQQTQSEIKKIVQQSLGRMTKRAGLNQNLGQTLGQSLLESQKERADKFFTKATQISIVTKLESTGLLGKIKKTEGLLQNLRSDLNSQKLQKKLSQIQENSIQKTKQLLNEENIESRLLQGE